MLKGSWVDDPMFSRLGGYSETAQLVQDGTLLYLEARDVKNGLFPYSIHDNDAPKFSLTSNAPNDKVVDILSKHLIDDDVLPRYGQRNRLYPPLGLKGLFEEIAQMLLEDGVVYFTIDWGTLPPELGSLKVPVSFRYLRTSTMREEIDKVGIRRYAQTYNSLVPPPDFPALKGVSFTFTNDEILHLKYPFGEPPVRAAAELARKSYENRQRRLSQTEASAYPEIVDIRLEQVRYASAQDLAREYDLTRAKIRKIFRLPFDDVYHSNGTLEVSNEYKAARLVAYLKYQAEFRTLLVNEFNRQVVERVVRLNSLSTRLSVKYGGAHPTEGEIEGNHKAFLSGDLTYNQFEEALLLRDGSL